MNANTFRLVFSKRLGMCVPVAEQRCAQGKSASENAAELVLKPLALCLSLLFAAPALALPVAPTVASGSATFNQSGSTLTVTNTPNAIINWGSFSIGQNELTKFVQQSSASAVLNRVTGQNPSQILGQLQSNGRVFLINPNGIVFGQGARIDTAGLIASTLNLSDADFLAGKLRLTGTGSEGKVENQGTINTANGGFVYLIAPNVENSGVIHAPNGDVLLAAGHSVEVADSLNPALRVVLAAPEGQVINLGQILAESGRIGLHAGLVANSGTVSASSAVAEGGKIYLRATEKIELTETSNLMADGKTGGEITAIVAKGGQISGELIARGNFSAQGGGGFIETSAAKLDISNIKVGATGGLWLIDPTDITINATDCTGTNCVAADAISGTLNAGTSISISTDANIGSDAGNINVNASISWNTSTLSLTASNDININAVMTATGTASLDLNTGTSGAVKVGFNADGSFKGRVDFGGRSGPGLLTINDFSYNVINTVTDLQGLTDLSGQYALGGNIDASVISNFVPIGNNDVAFTGSFEGLGHTINNLSINQPTQEYLGLFGAIGSGGTVRNVGLTNIGYTVGWGYVGGLAGSNMGRISNSYAAGAITSGNNAYNTGGLVGYNGGIIQTSHAAVTVTSGDSSDSIGGLVGIAVGGGNFNSAISNSYASGNVNVGANSYKIGGLLGAADATSISTSYATGAVTAGNTGQSIGGLVGLADGSSSIDKSHATGAVTSRGDGTNLGGLVGELGPSSTISNSHATGSITAGDDGSTLGGLVGYNNSYNSGSISTSYATGVVSSGNNSDQLGGLVGFHNGSLIQNSYATGSVTAGTDSDGIGGLVGYQTYVSQIQYSYATGKVTTGAGTTRVGGLVGAGCSITSTCDITSSFWDVDTTGRIDGIGSYSGNSGISGLYSATPTVNAYNQATYTGFDFTSRSPVWWISEGNTRPFLRMEWSNTITNAHQLQLMAMNLSASYTLANNLDLAPALNAVAGLYPGMWGSKGFVPVGNYAVTNAGLTGNFDGLNHTISNLAINRPTEWDVGLFGYVQGNVSNNPNVKNIALSNVDITGLNRVGGLVGFNYFSNINNASSDGSVTGNNNVGGLAGYSWTGSISSISNSYSAATVTGKESVGGLAGTNSGTISTSYSTGSVTGRASSIWLGGLVGYNDSQATISNSYSAGAVTAGNDSQHTGGLVGINLYGGASISNSYSTGSVTAGTNSTRIGGLVGTNVGVISKTYSAGSVTAAAGSTSLGGLVGSNTDGTNTGTTSYSFWDTGSSSLLASAGGSGLTTTEMKNEANFTSTAIGNANPSWDFSAIWNIDSGANVSYPYLRNPEQIPHPGLSSGLSTCSICTWDGGGGNFLWSLASNWTGDLLPAPASTVTIGGGFGTVLFDINSLSLASLSASSALDIQSGKTLTLTGNGTFNAPLSGSGTLDIAGAAVNANANTINIARLNLSAGSLSGTGNLTVSNNFNWSGGTLGSTFQNLSLTKQGNFSIGDISAAGNMTLAAQGGDLTLSGNVSKTGASASTLTLNADGTIVINSGVTITAAGTGNSMAFDASGGVTNNGTISPGGNGAVGTLNVIGNLALGATSTLNIDLGGTGAGQSDHVDITGNVTMGGTLNRSLINGYTPGLGDAIPFMTLVGSANGTFATENALAYMITGYQLAPFEAARQIFSGPNTNTFTNRAGGLTWETGGNWSAGYIPDATQTAIVTSSPLSPVVHSIGDDSIAGLLVNAGSALRISGGSLAVSGTTSDSGMLSLSGGSYANNGTLNIAGLFNLLGGTFTGAGAININGGTLNVPSDSTVNWIATGPMANSGTMSLANQTISNAITNSGTFNSFGGLTFSQRFTNQGTFNANSGLSTFSNGLTQNAGDLVLDGGNLSGNLTLDGGRLKGSGIVTGQVTVGAATLAPGFSPGTLNITGNLTLSPTSTTSIELWGTTSGLFDVVNVSGSASLAGALNATTGNGYVPAAGDTLRFMTFASSTGSFGSTSLPSGMSLSTSASALDLLGPVASASTLPSSVTRAVSLLDNSLNLGAVSYETPMLYITGQSSPTASSSGALTQTAEIVLPDLVPLSSGTKSGNPAFASLIPLFDQLTRDAMIKDSSHDSRLICR